VTILPSWRLTARSSHFVESVMVVVAQMNDLRDDQRTMKYACIAVLLLTFSTTITTTTASAQQCRHNPSSEPTTFIADEESFEPSVPIPSKVLGALVKTDAGSRA